MVSGKQPRTALAEINVTPLVDVMLVLLIIFMITAPMLQHEVDVNLPVASGKQRQTRPEQLVVTVTKEGKIYLNQAPYTVASLATKLQALARAERRQEIFLRADAEVPYGLVVRVMDAVKKAGIHKLGIITRPVAEQP